jgi:hypothetical protein
MKQLTPKMVVLAALLMSCGGRGWQYPIPTTPAPQTLPSQPEPGSGAGYPSVSPSTKLMLFGGAGHKTYLGCVNCSNLAPDSVFNELGDHGSRLATDSILNPFSDYGSPFSSYSACNPFADDPPVIVDGAGQFYGRLTVNTVNSERTHNTTLLSWLATVCERN